MIVTEATAQFNFEFQQHLFSIRARKIATSPKRKRVNKYCYGDFVSLRFFTSSIFAIAITRHYSQRETEKEMPIHDCC